MPLTQTLLRAIVAGAFGLLLLVSPILSAAEERRCVRGSPVRIDVAPCDADSDLAPRILAQMFSEVASPEDKDCTTDVAPTSTLNVAASLKVTWLAPLRAHIALALTAESKPYEATRDVDLEPIVDEGRPLALGIAAAEMLEALTERAEADAAEKPPVLSLPTRADLDVRPPPRVLVRARGSVGSIFSAEHYTAGLTLIGPDLRAMVPLAQRIEVGLRVGIRTPSLAAINRTEIRLSAAYVAGIAAQVSTSPLARRGFSAKAAVDAVWMHTTAPRSDEAVGVVGRVGMGAWETLDPGVTFVLEGTVGVPLKTIDFTGTSGASHPAVGGALFGVGAGIFVSF
jgi:hypothetical protein